MAIQGGGEGSSKSSGAVRMGRAFVEIAGDDTKLAKALSAAKRKVQDFGNTLAKAGNAAAVAGGVILAPLTRLFTGGVQRAAGLQMMADKMRVPIEQLSRLQHAADVAGVSLDEVMDNPGRFRDLIQSAPGLDEGTGRRAVAVQRAFAEATLSLKNAMLPLLEVLTPIVKRVAEFVKTNASALMVVAGVAAGIAAAGIAVAAFGAGLTAVVTVVGALISAWPALLALTAALVLGFDDIREGFASFAETAQTALAGIADALKAGDIELAAQIALAGVNVEWRKAVKFWTENWVAFKDFFVDGWHDIADGVRIVINDMVAFIEERVRKAMAGIKMNFVDLRSFLGGNAAALALQGMGGLTGEDAIKAGVEAKRKKAEQDILDRSALRRITNALFRQGQVDAADADLAGAQGELARLRNQAADAAAKAGGGGGGDFNLGAAVAATKGAFALPSALQQFGLGDSVGFQAKALNALGNLPVIKDEIKELNNNLKLR